MNKISYGKGDLGRIYEKLRKRSTRKVEATKEAWLAFLEWEANNVAVYDETWDREFDALPSWSELEHAAYVRGVREALAEVSEHVQRERVRAYAAGFEDGLETQDLERA